MGCGSSTEAAAPAPAETARRVPDAKPPTPQPQSTANSQRTMASSVVASEPTHSLPPSLTPSPRSPRSPRVVASPFVAYVVSDFTAMNATELSVKRGDFVTVEPVEGLPDGWCMASISISEPGRQKRAGLVPWQYLISSAHAEEAATAPRSREPERVLLEFTITRGKTGALGLDLDEENQVRRIAEGSSANGQLEVGDLVLAVDGKSLEGDMSILDVLDTSLSVYTFSVLRRELNGSDKDAYSAGIMDTMRLQEQGEGKGSTKYYSAPGRDPGPGGKGGASYAEEEEPSSARDSERSNTVDSGLPSNFFSPAQQVQQGARMTRLERVVKVRRTGTRLGIDINERNVIVKLIPGSHAMTDGNLREGDVVIAVDGEQLEGRWLAQVIRPGADTYLFTVVSEDWKIGTLQEQQGTGPNQLPDTAALRDIYSLKSWSLSDVAAAISSGEPPKAAGGAVAVRAPSALRDVPEEAPASFASPANGAKSHASSPPGTPSSGYRIAPRLPNNMSTMRMEDLLRGAMEAAAENPQHAKQFEEVLSRYKQHPGILRKEEEARARDRARKETFKPAYWAQRQRIPERVHLRMNSMDELVDAGCSWDLAEEIMRFPILKFLRATHKEMEALPIFETVQHNLDRRMGEESARAVIFALPQKFEIDKWQAATSKGVRQEWLETQHRIFNEMEENGFVPPLTPRPGQPQHSISPESLRIEEETVGDPTPSDLVAADHNELELRLSLPNAQQHASPPVQRGPVTPLAGFPLKQQQEQQMQQQLMDSVASGDLGTLKRGTVQSSAMMTSNTSEDAVGSTTGSVSSTTSSHRSVVTGAHRVKAKGGYRETVLKNRIGQGTYGSVFRGLCRDEEVAVKVMLLQADSAEDIKREIKIMRECACESIVAYKDAFIREHQMRSTLWVVMEFCEVGSTLDMMRRQNRALGEPEIAWIMRGVLIALDYLHTERKTIHRDIKAANILLTRAGEVKLADLGVAAQLYNTMSKRGTMIGTPHWMAPETLAQSGTDDGKYDVKVDVWGVGITAIELAQMSPPFADVKSVFQVMMLIVNGEPPKPEEHIRTTEQFKGFLSQALVKDPSKRPSAGSLLKENFVKGAKVNSLRDLIETHLKNKAEGTLPASSGNLKSPGKGGVEPARPIEKTKAL